MVGRVHDDHLLAVSLSEDASQVTVAGIAYFPVVGTIRDLVLHVIHVVIQTSDTSSYVLASAYLSCVYGVLDVEVMGGGGL